MTEVRTSNLSGLGNAASGLNTRSVRSASSFCCPCEATNSDRRSCYAISGAVISVVVVCTTSDRVEILAVASLEESSDLNARISERSRHAIKC